MKPPSIKQLEKQCQTFNERYPLGTPVQLIRDNGKADNTKVRGEAFVMGGHSVVAFFEGVTGCYLIDRVSPIAGVEA